MEGSYNIFLISIQPCIVSTLCMETNQRNKAISKTCLGQLAIDANYSITQIQK